MNVLVAAVAAGGVFVAVAAKRRERMAVQVGRYLAPSPADQAPGWVARLWGRVALWDPETVERRVAALAAGAVAGGLLAGSGWTDSGSARSSLGLIVLGALSGGLLHAMHLTTLRQRRARRLRFELPVVAETVGLDVLAGESVINAIARFVDRSEGVAADELGGALARVEVGGGLSDALSMVTASSADAESARLYGLLAHAHTSGGRLADALVDLAQDYRAALAREVTVEGGKRAVATYGPVLFLMVPVTLLFLLYPTIQGLKSLAP